MAGEGWRLLRRWRTAPAVLLALSLTLAVMALFVFVPHDQAVELIYKTAGAARAQRFMHHVKGWEKARAFVRSLKSGENEMANSGGLVAQVWGNSPRDQQKTYAYFSTLRARLNTLQSMLSDEGNSTGGNATNATNATEEEVDTSKFPPFDEPTELPDPACDVEAMANCLAEMQAEEKSELSAQEARLLLMGDDKELSHFFCEDIKAPFQCACKACNASQLKYWDNRYWTQDHDAKTMILRMRREARCHLLEHAGREYFPVGHGCSALFETVCEHDLNAHYCPAVLSDYVQDSRYSVAETLLDSRTSWINPQPTCPGERGRDLELECRKRFHNTFHEQTNYCGPYHDYLVCMCDSCEEDVERATTGMHAWRRCPLLNKTMADNPAPICKTWFADECEAEKGHKFCEAVEGSKAWKKTQPPPPPPKEYGWEEDGMPWKTFCKEVVASMADSETALELTVGKGWKGWCEEYLKSIGEDMDFGGDYAPPPGLGKHVHPRLPVSRLPAPRFDDHQDTV